MYGIYAHIGGYIHGKCYQLLSYIAYMDPMGNVLYHQFHEKKTPPAIVPPFHPASLIVACHFCRQRRPAQGIIRGAAAVG